MQTDDMINRPEFLPRGDQYSIRFDPETSQLYRKKFKSVKDIPLSEDYFDIDEFIAAIGPDATGALIKSVSQPMEIEDELAVFKRNLGGLDKAHHEMAIESFRLQYEVFHSEAINSHAFALANTTQIWALGSHLAVVSVSASGPQLICACPKDDQKAKVVWAVGFGLELLLGVLSILGVPKLSNSKLTKFLQKILENAKLAALFNKLTVSLSAAGIAAFIRALYDEGILGDLIAEALTGAGWAAIAFALTLIASKFFSGGTLLAVHAGIIAVELGYKLATRPF